MTALELERMKKESTFEPIGGLAYTREERLKELREAVAEYKTKKGTLQEEFKKEMEEWF